MFVGNDDLKLAEKKKYLDTKFNTKELGPLKYIIEIYVPHTYDGKVRTIYSRQ